MSVAFHARDTEDFPAFEVKGEVVDFQDALRVVHGQIPDAKAHVLKFRGLFVERQNDFASHHQFRHVVGTDFGDLIRAHASAVAHNRGAVADTFDFVQLVGNENNRVPVGAEFLQLYEQLVSFLRRQYGGRLVENQDVGAAVQGFQDFHFLLDADGDFLHFRRHVNVKIVLLGNAAGLLHGLFHVDEKSVFRLRAQYDILRDRQRRHQHKVLMYHADTLADGVHGRFNCRLLSVEDNLPGIGGFNAEQDFHQRGFSRAVFPQKGVNLAFFQGQTDILVSDDSVAVNFHDVLHLQDILLRHIAFPSL